MKRLAGMTAAVAATAGFAAATLELGHDDRSTADRAGVAAPASQLPVVRARTRFGGALEDCASRSEADFPGAFSDPRNLVVGPLVLIGGRYTDPGTVRAFGGNKFPLLVEAGHIVTVRLSRRARAFAGLAYGPLPQGEVEMRDTYRSVTFAACAPGRSTSRYSPDGPSGSQADGRSVTFWSGFVLTRRPACIPLEVHVNGEPAPRRASLALGRRCAR